MLSGSERSANFRVRGCSDDCICSGDSRSVSGEEPPLLPFVGPRLLAPDRERLMTVPSVEEVAGVGELEMYPESLRFSSSFEGVLTVGPRLRADLVLFAGALGSIRTKAVR